MIELLYRYDFDIDFIFDLFEFSCLVISYLKNDVNYNNLFIGAYVFSLISFVNFLDD